jgi:signal transduction histidine kinase
MQLELFSGGSEQTVGIMAIDDLSVFARAGTQGGRETVLFSSHHPEGKDLDQRFGVPRGWVRDGSNPATAQILHSDEYRSLNVLAVLDVDSSTWGAWRTDPNSTVAVQPGDTLLLQWNEMFSIGWGGAGTADYSYLAPGQYQFQVRAATETGDWAGDAVMLPFAIVAPFWQAPWFRGSFLVLAVLALAATVRYATWRKMQRKLERLEQQRAVERERTRIARDIHDDLGSNLTQIALLSELARSDLSQPEQAQTHLKQIFATARAVARQLDEIVWAITPDNDTVDQFDSYLCKFAQDYLSVSGIRCRLDIPESLPAYPMSSAERHNLFLAAKEALHNVVKHSGADQVWVRLKFEPGELVVLIEDNGKGMGGSTSAVGAGEGLGNMRNRLDHIGGRFEQESQPGRGTTVRLALPLSEG